MTDPMPTPAWLPRDFVHPVRVDLSTGDHLRPIRGTDVDIDFPAVMGSRERLWALYGRAWGWPPATMTLEEDRQDLIRHEEEIAAHLSFNYAVLDAEEQALLGCVYIDPPVREGTDAEISWWVTDEMVDSVLEHELSRFVPRWIAARWPFTAPFIGVP